MTEQPHPDELDLEGLRRRRPQAIARWFERYADPIYGFVHYRVGGDPDLAADAAQDTFVTALSTIDRFDPERGDMFPWLTFIARNSVRKVLRQNSRESHLLELWGRVDRRLAEALESLEQTPLPPDVLEREETQELVHAALAALRPRYRRALEQRYFEDLPLGEIAAREGATEAAVKVLLYRARRAFHAAFSALVGGLEDMGVTR
jgi:RNA polymerase sigma-70 factor (ECF subfamily)